MRKNDDGYVLPFVLVVMIVLCIISASLMTAAFRNLQMQQKFTDRMVDKYAAQGEIEKIVAELTQKRDVVGDSESLTPQKLSVILGRLIGEVTQDENTIGAEAVIEQTKTFAFTVSLESPADATTDTTIACKLLVFAKYTSTLIAESSEYQYTIEVTDLTYKSYEISTGGGT